MRTVILKTAPILSWLLILASCALVSCDASDQRAEQNELQSVNADPGDIYSPPSDGHLQENHVLQYLAVMETVQDLLKQQDEDSQSDTSPKPQLRYQDMVSQAITKHGLSPEEYTWIKNTIINSRIKAQFQEYFALNRKIITLLEGALQRHEATKSQLQDAEEIAILDGHVREIKDHIATLKTQIDKYTDMTASDQHNIELVKKFAAQLQTVEN